MPAYLQDWLKTQLRHRRKHEKMIQEFTRTIASSCVELREIEGNDTNLELRMSVPIETLKIKKMEELRTVVG